MQTNLEVEKGEYGPRLVLQGDWRNEFKDQMLAQNIRELSINYACGFNGQNLRFLRTLDFLEGLLLLVYHIPDVSDVQYLHNLRSFINGCRDKTALDFTQFRHLERCGIDWRPGTESLYECNSLIWLNIGKLPSKDVNEFKNLVNLKELFIASSPLEKLTGLQMLSQLSVLGLYRLNNLLSLESIGSKSSLEFLDIQTCTKLNTIAGIERMTNLKRLNIINCGNIASLEPVNSLSALRSIAFVGTNIVDGNLSVLAASPSLKEVFFDNHRHYTHRRQSLMQLNA